MVKELNGSELAGFIKERQAKQVRALRQAHRVFPKLVVIKSEHASPVIDAYVRMKVRYSEDILIETEVQTMAEENMIPAIKRANADDAVHGIIVQLPLRDTSRTNEIVNAVAPEKDVDGLGESAVYPSATADAINWLLAGYSIELTGKNITLLGNGRLIGAPLAKMWRASGHNVTVLDKSSENIMDVLQKSDIIVSATGVPGILTSDMIPIGACVVDAGTASEGGVIRGDVAENVRLERNDVIITPTKGGVGPLTISLLFDHVIQAANKLRQ